MTDDLVRAALALLRGLYDGLPLDPPLGWEAVYAFEQRHGVVLPEPYRSFIAEVGAGGRYCGPPQYGLQVPDKGAPRPGVLARSFPLTEAREWQGSPVDDPLAVDDGLLHLGTDGCDVGWYLVVTGPARGSIWLMDDMGAAPALDGGCSFVEWVADWNGDPEPFR